jgi:hypothetical protein
MKLKPSFPVFSLITKFNGHVLSIVADGQTGAASLTEPTPDMEEPRQGY